MKQKKEAQPDGQLIFAMWDTGEWECKYYYYYSSTPFILLYLPLFPPYLYSDGTSI